MFQSPAVTGFIKGFTVAQLEGDYTISPLDIRNQHVSIIWLLNLSDIALEIFKM